MPKQDYLYDQRSLKAIPYRDLDLYKKWQQHDIAHDLTVKGMERFSADWNALIKQS